MSHPSVHSLQWSYYYTTHNILYKLHYIYISCIVLTFSQVSTERSVRPFGRRPAGPLSKCKLNCEREYKIFIRKIEICVFIKINILDLAFALSPKVYSLQLFADPKPFVKNVYRLPNLPERLLYLIRVGFCVELSFQHFSILFLIG